jgi:Raf kinase inhibitor-like YbhB/YbcL family protein
MPFALHSPDIAADSTIDPRHVFNDWSCTGQNLSPALIWSGAPQATKSFALTCYDPDAPTGSGWWHWQIYNIPVTTLSLARGAGDSSGAKAPAGSAQSVNDYMLRGYGGPCPPPGPAHRYVFTVFALSKEVLELPSAATCAMVGFNINQCALAHASFTAKYGR